MVSDNSSERFNTDDTEEPNVSHFLVRTPPAQQFLPGTIGALRGQPQFPLTPAGQLERLFKQEFLDNERQRRLDEANTLAQQQLERAAEVARQLAEAAAEANAAAEKLAALHMVPPPEPPEDDEYRSTLHPADWSNYRNFRAFMQQAEASVRQTLELEPTEPVEKGDVAAAAGCSVRTITRRMKRFGLDPKHHWPPSTWPEQQPSPRMNQVRLLAHAAAAAMLIGGCIGKIDPYDAARWLLAS